MTGLSGGWRGEFAERQDKVTGGAAAESAGYVVHTLFTAYRPKRGDAAGFEFRVGIDNVLDKQFQRHLSSLPAEGRTFKVSVAKLF